ncbi:MAG: PAS domain-containing protein [Hyphomonadaceae bacterium]
MIKSLPPQVLVELLEASTLRVFWKDRDFRFLGCNQLFATDAGIDDPNHFVGKSDYYFFHPEQAAAFRADDAEVIRSGEAKIAIHERLTLISGETVWVETNKIPLRDEAGEVVGLIGTYQDITERKRAEACDGRAAA